MGRSVFVVLATLAVALSACGASSRSAAPPPREAALLCRKSTDRHDVVEFDPNKMQRPKILEQRAPISTEDSLKFGGEGELVIKCVVRETGWLESCCIVKGIDHWNGPVYDAVSTWRYEPIRINGQALDVLYEIRVRISSGHEKGWIPATSIPRPPPGN